MKDNSAKYKRNEVYKATVIIAPPPTYKVIITSSTAGYMDPLPVSPYDNGDASFQIVAVSALEVYPEAKVVPGLMIANTDTKHYASLAARWVEPK